MRPSTPGSNWAGRTRCSATIKSSSPCAAPPEDPRLFAYTRALGNKTLLTVCSLSGEPADFAPPAALAGKTARLLISNWEAAPAAPAAMTFQPWQAAVWVLED